MSQLPMNNNFDRSTNHRSTRAYTVFGNYEEHITGNLTALWMTKEKPWLASTISLDYLEAGG